MDQPQQPTSAPPPPPASQAQAQPAQPAAYAGQPQYPPPGQPPSQDLGDDAGMRMLLPVGQSGMAIVSGYLGLLSILGIPAPFAVITGILALREIKRNPKKHGTVRAVVGIVLGSIGTLGLLMAGIGLAGFFGR